VQESGPPKSVTVEDSFKSCPSFAAVEKVQMACISTAVQQHSSTLGVICSTVAQQYIGSGTMEVRMGRTIDRTADGLCQCCWNGLKPTAPETWLQLPARRVEKRVASCVACCCDCRW
jgi:hypothetical protein